MTARYRNLVFTPSVKATQERNGSRNAYAHDDDGADADVLTAREAEFIASRDSFYMATVGAGGWPYVQHRGGPAGFVKVLGPRTLGFADFRGNRQYVSVGNFADDGRASLFFMDYARRARLKVLGRARVVEPGGAKDIAKALALPGYDAKIERALLIEIEAFDWNCPQHITPRFSLTEIAPTIDLLKSRVAELEAELTTLKSVQLQQ